MLTVISPAKRLDFEQPGFDRPDSQPEFGQDAYSLSRTARRLSVKRLQKLMGISEGLAKLNQERFKNFEEEPARDATKQAALAFAGDTYAGLDAGSLDADEMAYAQNHLRILSGLYGLLRPLDLIQPYRLEMGSRLATRRGKSLYQYWGTRLASALEETAADVGSRTLVNCASVEYFSAVPKDAMSLRLITPVFMEDRDGKRAIVSFFAKKARGAMARFIIQNRIRDPEGMKDFETGGYRFDAGESSEGMFVFVRDYPEVV